MTPEQIKSFQRTHVNHLGEQLDDDGDIGPETQWALDIATLSLRRQFIVRRAVCCIAAGIDEKLGPNRHPIIDLFNAWANADDGDPWCASLACACMGEIAIPGAMALLRCYPLTTTPLPGDLMGFPTGTWEGHVEIVTGLTDTEAMGAGGNVGNRARATRRLRSAVQFRRVVNSLTGKAAGIPPGVGFVETRSTTEGTR